MNFSAQNAARRRRRQGQRGSVLVIGLLLVAFGTLGMTAWVMVIQGRAGLVEALEHSASRRISLENSKAVARRALSELAMGSDSGLASNYEVTIPDGWGSVSIAAFADAPLAYTGTVRYNQVGGVAPVAYSLDVTAALGMRVRNADNDGWTQESVSYLYELKSRSPAFSGQYLRLHTPTLTEGASRTTGGSLGVRGHTIAEGPGTGLSLAHESTRFAAADGISTVALPDAGGGVVLPDNVAFVPRTTGVVAGTAADFSGRLSVVKNDATACNSQWHQATSGTYYAVDGAVPLNSTEETGGENPAVSSTGTGEVRIRLAHALLDRDVVISGNTSTLYLIGQTTAAGKAAAASFDPLRIVLVQPAGSAFDLGQIEFQGENSRRLILAIKKEGGGSAVQLSIVGSGFPVWRGLFDFENFDASVTHAGTAGWFVEGGLRTDRGITGGSLVLREDTAPGDVLPGMASRDGWVEAYRN